MPGKMGYGGKKGGMKGGGKMPAPKPKGGKGKR